MNNNENNVQNQEKNNQKGVSAGLIIMLIAVLIIGIGGGYLLSKKDKLFNKNETQPNANTQQNQTTSNNDTNTTVSNYDTAIDEIKKCLKDGKWLKEKEIESQNAKIYFAKLNNVGDKPYYVVRSDVFDSSYLKIVSYDGNNVTVTGHCGADYANSVKVDINNNIVEVNATTFIAYYKIENGNFVQIARADNSGDGVDKERTELEKEYGKKYNFVEITTELTNSNIDMYIK